MAKKPRGSKDEGPKRRKPTESQDGASQVDRKLVEQALRDLMGKMGSADNDGTPRGKAQSLMYQAYEEADATRRVRFAKQALDIDPDCADAYILQAEHCSNRKEALRLYEQGVAAGERSIGPDSFQSDVGHFWGMLETRPYMRAKLGLSHLQWSTGHRAESAQHLQDMLRLNPGDNQGVRYTLAGYLLFLDQDKELEQLLQQFSDEDSATWIYTKALLAFRKFGDSPTATKLLKSALKANKHVPKFILGLDPPPAGNPSYYSPGDENEALNYIGGFLAGWRMTAGAVAWLRANSKKPKPAPQAKGPLGLVKNWLNKNLQQEVDVWQAVVRQLPNWVTEGGELKRPWAVVVMSHSNDFILDFQLSEELPTAALIWDRLANAMRQPQAGTPHRPTELHVLQDPIWESLTPHLLEIGMQVTVCQELDKLEGLFQVMCEQVCGQAEPGLLDMPLMKQEQVAKFYGAAAHFFRQAPWKKLGYEHTIKIECDKFQSGPWYAIVMGQSGLTIGMALYEDLNAIQRMWREDDTDEESTRETVVTSVTFNEECHTRIADADASKKHGWEIARPDAYPEVMHKERGMSIRPPLAWELELLEGCLRAIPDFVDHHHQDDHTTEVMTVPAASGILKLTLAWVADS